ncbi:MAG TPA: preprotein translocase subunit YajC [Eubacteriales bacterium]|nr:preprotein translocase subunit YajC [Eubacteriales bacterium]
MNNNYIMLIILGAFFVLMIVMTIIPQRRRKKQMDQMMANLAVGTKIMTIGRMVGTIVAINNVENQLVINVGSENSPTLITIDKGAVGMVLTASAAPVAEFQAEKVEETTVESVTDTTDEGDKI